MTDPLFARLLESLPDAMIIVDSDGKIVLVNRLTEVLFGYDRSELVGKTIELLVSRDAKADHEKLRNGYLNDPTTRLMGKNKKLRGRTRKGREFPVDISLGPIEIDSGTLVLAVVRDITGLRRAEANALAAKDKITASGKQLRDAIESVGEGFVLYDSLGRLALCNNAFRDFYGYSEADTETGRFTPGKGLTGQVIAGGQPIWIVDVTKDMTFECTELASDLGVKTGLAFPVMTGKKVAAVFEFFSYEAIEPNEHMLDVMARIGTQLGRVVERQAAQKTIRESEEHYRFVMDHSPAAVHLKDKQGRYVLANARFEEWYGVSSKDIIGKTAKEVFPHVENEVFLLRAPRIMP